MLIQFTVKNFLSYKDEVVFSMLASKDSQYINENTFSLNKRHRLLRSAAIYGANASGKSSLFKAIGFMKNFVVNSSKSMQAKDLIAVENFKLSTETENLPSLFEVIFSKEDVQYRYGFEVTKKEVISEWLFASFTSRESKLFIRKKQEFDIGDRFKEGKELEKKTRNNALFLSVVSQFNGEISKKVLDWFYSVNVISGLNNNYANISMKFLEEKYGEKECNKLLKLMKLADLGIEELQLKDTEIDSAKLLENLTINLPQELLEEIKSKKSLQGKRLHALHPKFNNDEFENLESFDFNVESVGTKKLFNLAGPIIDTLYKDKILFIDEIENSLHPVLLEAILNLFRSDEDDFSKAQFIFTTHNTNLLSKKMYRRDQIWFTEKDKFGVSKIFSLLEFNEHIRKDAAFEKNYLNGRYGAIPHIYNLFEGDGCSE